MPAMLELPKQAAKHEEFVEKQIESARGRIRGLDILGAGLMLASGSLTFVLAALLIDRYVETPAGTGWAAIVLFLLGAAGFVYWSLFRPSRRSINPYYAARKVERSIADAKNSVVNYVDLKDDETIPGSVKAAIGTRAAKDLKRVDLHEVIQKKQVLYLATVAGILTVAALIAYILPPTRTTMVLLEPKDGDVTILQGEEFRIQVQLTGRIPEKTDPDVARIRMWYNPDDPDTYEERPLDPVEGQKGIFGLTVPAKQTRSGFRYRVLVAKSRTRDFEVKVRIIPQFTGWKVEYKFPDYLGREAESGTDPNLVGYYGTQVVVTAFTNRPVKSGVIVVNGAIKTIPGHALDDNPEAIRFQFSMDRTSKYSIQFVTTDGDPNPDPKLYNLTLMDPKPAFLNYDVTYDYPKYLRYDPPTATINFREPHLEAMRGTKVVIVAHANRPVKSATLQFPNVPPIVGELVEGKPLDVTFTLPALMDDGAYRVWFSPTTDESDSEARVFNIKVLGDEKPKVEITKPMQEEIELPANGTLAVEGIATDDFGLAKMNLRMEIVSPGAARPLAAKPYRNGLSFQRKEDNSYPTHIDYKDFVELANVKPDGEAGAGFKLAAGMTVEYWLEAIDNCDIPPGPNSGMSRKLRIKILPEEKAPDKQKQREEEKKELEKKQKEHDQKQDKKNTEEKRDKPQPPQKKDQPQQKKDQPQQGGNAEPKKDSKNEEGGKKEDTPKNGDMPPPDKELQKDADQVKNALDKTNPDKDMGGMPDTNPPKKEGDPPKGKNGEPKTGDMGTDTNMNADPQQLSKPEDFEKLADKLNSDDPKEREQAREQLKKMMEQTKKDPPKPDDAKKNIDEHRKKLDNDEQEKFDKAMEKLQKEMQNLNREDNVKNAADKAMSDKPMERAEGQKQLEDLMRNPKTREDVERQLQRLAGDQQDERKRNDLEDAKNLSRKNVEKQEREANNPPMKKKEEDVPELAKKLQKKDPKEKQAAQDELEKKLKDPMQRDEVKKQLDEIRNNIKDEQARKNFDESMKQINDNIAKNDLRPKPSGPTAEDVQKLADKLNSNDKGERDSARKDIERSVEKTEGDPKAQEASRKQMQDLRDGIKEEQKKKEFDKAVSQIDRATEEIRQDKKAKADQQRKDDVDKVAKGLNDKDSGGQQSAQRNLEEMLKDPKTRDAVKNQLDKAKQGMDEMAKKNIDDAVAKAEENIGKKQDGPGKVKPEDVQNVTKGLNDKDAAKQQAARDELEKMLRKDPKGVKDQLDKAKQGMDETGKQNIDDAVAKAEQKIGKSQGGSEKVTPEDVAKMSDKLQHGTPDEKQQAQKQLEKMLRDPKTRADAQKQLDQIKNDLKDGQARKDLENAIQQAKNSIGAPKIKPEDVEKIVKQLQSGDPMAVEQAKKEIDGIKRDPRKLEEFENQLAEMKKDPKKAEEIEKATKQLVKGEIEKIADKLKNGTPAEKQTAKQKLEDLLKNPLDREVVKQNVEDYTKDIKDDAARKEFEKQLKEIEAKLAKEIGKKGHGELNAKHDGKKSGQQTSTEPKAGALADLKNKVRAGELLLEKFKRNVTNEELRKQLGWTPEQMDAFLKKYGKQVAELQKQLDMAEKGQLPMPRAVGPSFLNSGGPEKIATDPRDTSKPLGGSKFVAPPGFGDPYKRFTEDRPVLKK